MNILHLIYESFRFAMQALRGNPLRTLLSLLSVTIGIFSIIGVFTMVDSLEKNIRGSLKSIGEKVIYVEKFPWLFEDDYPWWRYFRRPMPKYSEFKYLKENMQNAEGMIIMSFKRGVTCRNGNNSYDGLIQGITHDFNIIMDMPIENGRYFTPQEIEAGRNVVIIGADVAKTLFGDADPLGKTLKVKGINFICIGVQEKKGEQILDIGGNPDEKVFMPFFTHKKLFSSGNQYGMLAIKGRKDDDGLQELESELTGLLRTKRGLRPAEEDNFAINRPEAAAKAFGQIFGTLRVAGFFIGIFALLIGGFGIANIMFVSVKERTNIIGIQKSLGAKNYFILFQFLFEAIFLCLLGGFFGILIVYGLSFISLGSLDLVLTSQNVIMGLSISTIIGVLSGIIPAWMAARLDPVIAIRSK